MKRPIAGVIAGAIAGIAGACSAPVAAPDAWTSDATVADAGPHDAGSTPDVSPPDADGLTLGDGAPCGGALELGRCALVDGGLCVGTPGEPAVFVPMVAGDAVPAVLGPQGATMLVLGARTRGIAPGDPTMPASRTNPTVEIRALDATSTEVAVYRGRATFAPDAVDPTLLVQPSFFVVLDGPAATLAGTLSARATVVDALGATRCGSLVFTATH